MPNSRIWYWRERARVDDGAMALRLVAKGASINGRLGLGPADYFN